MVVSTVTCALVCFVSETYVRLAGFVTVETTAVRMCGEVASRFRADSCRKQTLEACLIMEDPVCDIARYDSCLSKLDGEPTIYD